MNPIDGAVIVLYFVAVVGTGFWYQRRAGRNLDSYFLGGKRLPWWMLAMSGGVSNFDITGTMWIVTLVCLFGMQSMWNHWMWGFLMGAFFLAYMGKWIRRSKVMTGAEWMVTRFGDGPDGQTARIAYAVVAVVTVAAFIGYAFQGIGTFSSVFLSVDPRLAAAAILGVTTLYVLLGGLYSVVITDVIQTVILTLGAVLIAIVAHNKITPEVVQYVHSGHWGSLVPAWRIEWAGGLADTRFKAYAGYELFGALVIVWVVKGLLLNLGGPAQMYDFQRFLAARDPRDAAKIGAAWSVFLIVRWAMVMGIALLAFSAVIHTAGAEGLTPMSWVRQVKNPEKIMPLVLNDKEVLPDGVRGIVIAGLLAAFMSTFSSTVNAGASYLVRDIWQPLVRPRAGQKHLVRVSYVATVALVVVGSAIGYYAASIAQMFNWIMIELGAAFVIPNVLRWYWWRMNGWGYAAGTFAGLAGAVPVLLLTLFWQIELPMYATFPTICGISLAACLAGSLLTRPTERLLLRSFYRSVRPFGFWGPIRRQADLSVAEQTAPGESALLAGVNVVLGGVVILGAYLAPMYLVGHWYGRSAIFFGAAVAGAGLLYVTWYRNLPAAERAEA